MNRIEPERVATAFKAHPEIKPRQHRFIIPGNSRDASDVTSCCGTSILLIDEDFDLVREAGSLPLPVVCSMLATKLGLSRDYVHGFTNGWDGAIIGRDFDNSDFVRGYNDGFSAWEATKEALSC